MRVAKNSNAKCDHGAELALGRGEPPGAGEGVLHANEQEGDSGQLLSGGAKIGHSMKWP